MANSLQGGAGGGPVTVTLSVKNVPADLARRLRERASRHHRSLQGELMAILTGAVEVTTVDGGPAEAAAMLRDDRHARRR
jgi:plasmid stability protein